MQRVIITFLIIYATPAYADLLSPWHYIRNYNLGVDVGETTDSATIEFEVDAGVYEDKTCKEQGSGSFVCTHNYVSHTDGFGLFFEQPFKRKGFWHFDYDLALDVRVVDDKMSYVGDLDTSSVPIEDLRIHLYSVVALPQITFGITPAKYPEILISLGPSGELVWGSVNINNRRQVVSPRGVFRRSAVADILSFQEIELVISRFGKGYLSLSSWKMYGDDHVQDGDLLPDSVGELHNLKMKLNKNFFGLKLLLK